MASVSLPLQCVRLNSVCCLKETELIANDIWQRPSVMVMWYCLRAAKALLRDVVWPWIHARNRRLATIQGSHTVIESIVFESFVWNLKEKSMKNVFVSRPACFWNMKIIISAKTNRSFRQSVYHSLPNKHDIYPCVRVCGPDRAWCCWKQGKKYGVRPITHTYAELPLRLYVTACKTPLRAVPVCDQIHLKESVINVSL